MVASREHLPHHVVKRYCKYEHNKPTKCFKDKLINDHEKILFILKVKQYVPTRKKHFQNLYHLSLCVDCWFTELTVPFIKDLADSPLIPAKEISKSSDNWNLNLFRIGSKSFDKADETSFRAQPVCTKKVCNSEAIFSQFYQSLVGFNFT